jgi:hypothetical protein
MALLQIRYLRLYFVTKNTHLVGFKPMTLSSILFLWREKVPFDFVLKLIEILTLFNRFHVAWPANDMPTLRVHNMKSY